MVLLVTRSLMYFSEHHMDVYIALKKSLKWVPVVGWVSSAPAPQPPCSANNGLTDRPNAQAMQIFDFLFLARSWAHDKVYLARKLAGIGRRAERSDDPLALFIFPEGTLVSSQTRPLSKKYADKMGIVRAYSFAKSRPTDRFPAGRYATHAVAAFYWATLLSSSIGLSYTEPKDD